MLNFDQPMHVQDKKQYWYFPLQQAGELKIHTQHVFAAFGAKLMNAVFLEAIVRRKDLQHVN